MTNLETTIRTRIAERYDAFGGMPQPGSGPLSFTTRRYILGAYGGFPRIDILADVAHALNTTVAYLIGERDSPKPKLVLEDLLRERRDRERARGRPAEECANTPERRAQAEAQAAAENVERVPRTAMDETIAVADAVMKAWPIIMARLHDEESAAESAPENVERPSVTIQYTVEESPMPRDRDDEQLRLDCLKLGISWCESFGEQDALVSANKFYAFVTGQSDKTPREAIDAALAEAGIK